MKIVIQRVSKSSVSVNKKTIAEINQGLTILLGIELSDNQEDIEYLCHKITNLRIFDDEAGIMNKSVTEINGDIIVISQFTLHASTKKGNRPSYIKAAPPEYAKQLYEKFCITLENKLNKKIQTGNFGAHMSVEIINDGPVTILIDSKLKE